MWVNLAEMCLLSQDRKNYRNFELILKDHEDEFQKYRPTTTAYLKAYYHFLLGKLIEFKKEIEAYISNAGLYLAVERLGSSQMDEFYAEQLNSTSPYKDIMLAFVDYLRGAKSEDEMKLVLTRV